MTSTPTANATASKLGEHKRMLKLTWPILKNRLLRHKGQLVILGTLAVMLGLVPTLKSELESGVVQQINDEVRPPQSSFAPADTSPTTPGGLFAIPLERFNQRTTSDQDGVPERLARVLFRNITLGWAVLIYLLIAVIVFAIELGSKVIQAGVSKELFAELRGSGLRSGLLTDPRDLPDRENAAGNYAMAIQQGATNVTDTYGYMLDAGQHIFALVTTIVLVATKSWIFAVSALALVLGQVAISVVQARRLEQTRTDLDADRNGLSAQSDDLLSKREILLAYEQGEKSVNKLNKLTETYAETGRKLSVREQKYQGLVQLLSDFGRILILLLALALALIFGNSAISNIGDAFFLLSIYVRIFVPASNLLMRYDSIKRSEATSKTFLDVIDSAEKKRLAANSAENAEWLKNREIKFSDVSFWYRDNEKRVLQHCTFTLPAGKTTLLVGPSGSGKSTIARLLLKFWSPRSGSIEVGGREINEYSAREVRAHMSFVSQRDHIVEDTVENNLSWGYSKDGISPERMREIIKRVKIDTTPESKDILKVKASKLSQGEQQRLSIARMMLDESEIVIMDEPLTGVDVFTIRDLLPHLISRLREGNQTVLMISHRLAFAGYADHVVVLNSQGQVVEEGAPADLIDRKGTFTSLFKTAVNELGLPFETATKAAQE